MSKAGGTSLSAELTFDEMLRARQVFIQHTDEYITTPFQLRTILSELGQYPQDAELNFCVEAFGNKMTFNNFTMYLSFLKRRFMKPEPQDVDTLRAFVALGGGADRRGDINAENLRSACRHFDLTIDIDAMIREVDDDNSGKLEFNEFKSMWLAAADGGARADAGNAMDDLAVDDTIFQGTLRSSAAAAAAKAAAAAGLKPQDEEPEPEEDTIDLLKQHLFPSAKKPADGTGRKPTSKRTSLITTQRIPIAPTRGTGGGGGDNANGGAALDAGGKGDKGAASKDAHGSDSDSDDGEAPQAYLRNQYKPPSPVILSMRNIKPPPKSKFLSSTSGGSARGMSHRAASPPSQHGTPRLNASALKSSSSVAPKPSPRKAVSPAKR